MLHEFAAAGAQLVAAFFSEVRDAHKRTVTQGKKDKMAADTLRDAVHTSVVRSASFCRCISGTVRDVLL